jgi:hypothetical protein
VRRLVKHRPPCSPAHSRAQQFVAGEVTCDNASETGWGWLLRARPDSVTLMEGLNEISVLDGGSEDERAEVRDDDAPCSEKGF